MRYNFGIRIYKLHEQNCAIFHAIELFLQKKKQKRKTENNASTKV